MTDKEILKRIEDRLDVAIGNLEPMAFKNSGTDYAFTIIINTRNYIREGKKLQKLRADGHQRSRHFWPGTRG